MRVSNVRANSASLSSTCLSSTSLCSQKMSKASRADHADRHVIALGLAIVSLTASERAAAECTPKSPVNDQTVTCTGTTVNQNTNRTAKDGYGSETDTGNTITVQSGASVTGERAGLVFENGKVNNL